MPSSGVFLYFLPGYIKPDVDGEAKKTTRSELLASPLAFVLLDVLRTERLYQTHLVQHFVQVGPNGSSGVLLVAKALDWPDAHRIGFYANEQTWIECDGYWLGHHNEIHPGPDSLQRLHFVDGYEYELGDGNAWVAPVIRWPGGAANLPSRYARHRGQFAKSVLPEFKTAWELAQWIWDAVLPGGPSVSEEKCFEVACECLGVNYRVGVEECSALGLLTSDTAATVFRAAVDVPRIQAYTEEQSKKNVETVGA